MKQNYFKNKQTETINQIKNVAREIVKPELQTKADKKILINSFMI